MAFSKGKRIEDETSTRIIDLAVNIGCKEGPDALTVTRICKELNCDRRVIYNRFRDVDEIVYIVAERCNSEIVSNAQNAIKGDLSFADNFKTFIKSAFTYIYEKNVFFQYYTSLYQIGDAGVENGVMTGIENLMLHAQQEGSIKAEIDCKGCAQIIWHEIVGISGILAKNVNYKYQEALKTLMSGVDSMLLYSCK